jgi:hypothetical protein
MRIRRLPAAAIAGAGSVALATAGVIASPAAPASADSCHDAGILSYHPWNIDGGGAEHWSCTTSPVYDWAGWATFSHCSNTQGCNSAVANDAGGASDWDSQSWHIYSHASFTGAQSVVSFDAVHFNLGHLRNNNRSGRWG